MLLLRFLSLIHLYVGQLAAAYRLGSRVDLSQYQSSEKRIIEQEAVHAPVRIWSLSNRIVLSTGCETFVNY